MIVLCEVVLACGVGGALPAAAWAETASQPGEPAAGRLDLGAYHSCALLDDGSVRCWGFGGDGQLGYGSIATVGDDETPASAGPVALGGRKATTISAGESHTCALLDDASVRCWGFGANGRLGYGSIQNVGDSPTRTPATAGPVNVGGPAIAIAAGGGHTCAILDDGSGVKGSVRCWGYGGNGQLGYGTATNVGDTPTTTPDKAGPVNLGGLKAIAITAGQLHTCALLEDHTVRCWGYGARGQLGYGNSANVGATPTTTPDKAGPVNLGAGRKAIAISAGESHTCAILDDGSGVKGDVRCWGFGAYGRLGYGNEATVGDTTTPDTAGPVNFGGHAALAITAGGEHTCARLDDQTVRCWGRGFDGQLGYGNRVNLGDNETPDTVGPVNLGNKAVAVSAGLRHTCARLDDGSVRCWGYGGNGRLGYCNENNIGDDELPGAVGPVDIGGGGAECAPPPGGPGPGAGVPPGTGVGQSAAVPPVASADALRALGLRSCLGAVVAHVQRERRLARHGSSRRRARARAHLRAHARSGRRGCLRRFARVPGAVSGLRAQTIGSTEIELIFNAPGTDGSRPPAARSYVVKQSRRPIRSARSFARAQALCGGACRFDIGVVGGTVSLRVTDLRPHTTYYYAVAARDNVSARRGPQSAPVKARTR